MRAAGEPGWVCTDCSATQVLTSGEQAGEDFGRYEPVTIAGTVYEDLDGDGARDPGEPGLSGRQVYFDADDDDVADIGEPSTHDATPTAPTRSAA